MQPADLIAHHAMAWHAATHHPFLDAVRDGTLDSHIFATWLVQDYLFVSDEFASQARFLARVPRATQPLMIKSLAGLESELGWFESHARQRGLSLHTTHHAVTASYRTFLQTLDHVPYAVGMTMLWAVERAYLDSWMQIAPGQPPYRDYIEHWANAEFASFVVELEQATASALATCSDNSAAEAAFLNVAQLEHAFWQMAWTGGVH